MSVDELVELFLVADTTAICDADKTTRVMDSAIRPRSAKTRIFGPALTVRCRDDFLAVLRAIEMASPGNVVVVDGGQREIALAGELFARGALVRGLGGIIVDAGYRDMAYVVDCELPIYSRFVTPLAGTASKLGELQIPVTCGGVSVNPGDVILADDEGVIVVDPNKIRTLLEAACAIKESEGNLIERLNTGFTLSDGLNLLEHVDALSRSEPSSLEFRV
ncbi:MAG: RraA family protein [Actinomycetota bacterium]|nr:RraA family protein [Actinomycetota bacterium]